MYENNILHSEQGGKVFSKTGRTSCVRDHHPVQHTIAPVSHSLIYPRNNAVQQQDCYLLHGTGRHAGLHVPGKRNKVSALFLKGW
jgi:hypothetical protein